MNCVIYKGSRKEDHYLYVEREDDFERVPEDLLKMLSELSLVITLELRKDRELAQADVNKVMQSLTDQGYYLQVPPRPELGDNPLPERLLR
ncbi:MAG TPA: YcgL domain-containing protein [Chromatiales bacterium]|nr:YcgL domain-containing protein [Chromatiales bacterium]HEX22310.1 YcgL domain-containing protein [Chromatiales bacterium]